MKFAIVILSPPQAPSARRALRFCEALLAGGHELSRLFLYRDGVHNASHATVSGQDESDLPARWRELIERHQIDAVVCIAAALKRGLLDENEARRYDREGAVNVRAPWQLSGLGQLHEAVQDADRLLCFGGD